MTDYSTLRVRVNRLVDEAERLSIEIEELRCEQQDVARYARGDVVEVHREGHREKYVVLYFDSVGIGGPTLTLEKLP